VLKSDGTWSAPLVYCTGTAITCLIPISSLQDAPFNLENGASVVAKVTATNLVGSSIASNAGTGAVIQPKLLTIFLPKQTLNAVIGEWASLKLP